MKKGLIKVCDKLYREEWRELYIFMKDFRPTHIEFRHWENNVWYMYGESDLFAEVKEGEVLPQYEVIFTKQEDQSLSYEIKQVLR